MEENPYEPPKGIDSKPPVDSKQMPGCLWAFIVFGLIALGYFIALAVVVNLYPT